MPPELVESLTNVCGGSTVLTLFGVLVFQIWRHRRPEGPMTRGIAVRTEPLDDALLAPLRSIRGMEDTSWGWFRAEGDTLLVFDDPMQKMDGHFRLRTFWPYIAEIRFTSTGAQVTYRAPLLSTILLGPLFLPLAAMPLLFHIALLARVRERMRWVADEYGSAPADR